VVKRTSGAQRLSSRRLLPAARGMGLLGRRHQGMLAAFFKTTNCARGGGGSSSMLAARELARASALPHTAVKRER